MPKLSDDTLLARSLEPAMLDRESFAEAVTRSSPEGVEALALADRIKALRGKKLDQLSPDEERDARAAFLFAQQWEEGFADSKPGKKWETKALLNARLFREVRLRRWGKTQLEARMAEMTPVSAFDLLR